MSATTMNSNFTASRSRSAVRDANAQQARIGDLHVGSIKQGGRVKHSVTAFAAAGFDSTGAASTAGLVNEPGAAAIAANGVVIPSGAIVERVYMDDNGTAVVGTTTLLIGTDAAFGSAGTPHTGAIAIADTIPGTLEDALAVDSTALTADGYLGVLTGTGAVSAGDLRVIVEYSVLA